MDKPTYVFRRAARSPVVLACMLLFGLDWSAAAQNALVFNPEFDVNVEDWGIGAAQVNAWDADDADACPQSGSFSMTSTSGGEGSIVGAYAPECLTVSEGDEVRIEVTYRSPNPVALYLLQYTTTNCSGDPTNSDAPTFPASAGWSRGAAGIVMATPTNVQSVRFIVTSADPDPNNWFTAKIDRAYLGYRSRVFADDFDGGSTCRWSSDAP